MNEVPYEMPFETEESYFRKIEAGKIQIETKVNDNWIRDDYFEDME